MHCHRCTGYAAGLQRLGKRLPAYVPAEVVTDDPQKPEAKPRVVGYGFSCGRGSCKVFSMIDGTPLPKLQAPAAAELPAPEPDDQ